MPKDVRETSQAERDESPSERADRNFVEVLQELRVAEVGVQVLFGFLLSLSFYSRFPIEREPYPEILTAALLCSGGAMFAFFAPVALHRLVFRTGRKEALVWLTGWMSLVGLALMLVAMLLSVWLVVSFLWSDTVGWIVFGALSLGAFVAMTAALVFLRRV